MTTKKKCIIYALSIGLPVILISVYIFAHEPPFFGDKEIPEVEEVFLPTNEGQKYSIYSDDIDLGNGQRQQSISSRPKNIYEDDGWKRIEDAKSLKSVFRINYSKEDENFGLRVEDFNYNSVRFCLNTTQLNQDIPFKVFKKVFNEGKVEKILEEIELVEGVKTEEPEIKFTDTEEKCFTININPLYKHLEWGFNSTEVSFDDPTEDGYIHRDETDYYRWNTTDTIRIESLLEIRIGYVEWNIGSIDDDVTIDDVIFKYHGSNHGAKGDSHIHEMVGVQPSAENDDNTGNQNIYDEAGEGTVYADPAGFPVVATGQQVDLGTDADSDLESQLSVDWFAMGIQMDAGGPFDNYASIKSEDYATPDPPPTLTVTYSAAGPEDTCTPPADDVWKMDLQDHCTTTDSVYLPHGMECYNQSGGSWVIGAGTEVRVASSTGCIPQIEGTGVFSIQPNQ